MGLARVLVWGLWLALVAHTGHCWWQQGIQEGLSLVVSFPWGLQVTADLYVGLLIFCAWVLSNPGHGLAKALWILAALSLGNLATLPYLALNLPAWPRRPQG